MKKFEFNLIDNIFLTSVIIIVGLSGFGRIGIALAIPILIFYFVLRPYIIKTFLKKEDSKEPSNQKEFDEFDEFDDEFDKKN